MILNEIQKYDKLFRDLEIARAVKGDSVPQKKSKDSWPELTDEEYEAMATD